jgi:hypothetical protein
VSAVFAVAVGESKEGGLKMPNSVALITGKLYQFRGVQLRYSHQRQCPEQSRYVFFDSLGKRQELGAQIVRREVQEIREFAPELRIWKSSSQ